MKDDLISYMLYLADNALIMGQRNAEWCGHGPVLEQDIAITNISLDLIGQARNLYQYASLLKGNGCTEDTLAYLRKERAFKNCLLVEQPNGDWGQTILKQFFFSAYQFFYYQKLTDSKDEQLSAIAEKSIKEVAYHLRWSSEWVIRLGDGTQESHERMLKAIDGLWMYMGELFVPAAYEISMMKEGIGVDPMQIESKWHEKVGEIFTEATLPLPKRIFQQKGGKQGLHTEHLGYILTDLQFMQRAYPNNEW